MDILELKNIITEIKNSINCYNIRLNTTEDRISE